MFEIQHDGSSRGYVVVFEAAAAPQDTVYVVRNTHHQDLGIIDSLGRAFRYRPHENEPAWLGSGSVAHGLQRILDSDSMPEMHEIPLSEIAVPSVSRVDRSSITRSQKTN